MSHSDPCARCGYTRRSHIDTVAGLLCPNAKFQARAAAPSPSPSSAPRAEMIDALRACAVAMDDAVYGYNGEDCEGADRCALCLPCEKALLAAADRARKAIDAAPASPQGEPTHYAPALAVGACAEGETSGPFTGHPSLVTCHACQNYVWMEIGRYRASPQGERERALEEALRGCHRALMRARHTGHNLINIKDYWTRYARPAADRAEAALAASSPHYAEKGD